MNLSNTFLSVIAAAAIPFAIGCGGSAAGSAAQTQTAAPAEASAADTAKAPVQTAAGLAAAPAFKLTDISGTEHSLEQYKGKMVVLEWFNPGCPFVKYTYDKGPMKALQTAELAKGDVVWLSVNSGGPGKQGHGLELNKAAYQNWSMNHTLLMDETGEVGKLYGAKSTPAMVVVDKSGQIIYRGALDNAPLGKSNGDPAQNYVSDALASARAGQPIAIAETVSYGCGVKYAN